MAKYEDGKLVCRKRKMADGTEVSGYQPWKVAIWIMKIMAREKKWVKSWSRAKKKARAPLKNKTTRVLCYHSHSMNARGNTPLGAALNITKKMIEDKEQIPSRAYRPTVVLVSDGDPNDAWQEPLQRFMTEGRSAKCYRMAIRSERIRRRLYDYTCAADKINRLLHTGPFSDTMCPIRTAQR